MRPELLGILPKSENEARVWDEIETGGGNLERPSALLATNQMVYQAGQLSAKI